MDGQRLWPQFYSKPFFFSPNAVTHTYLVITPPLFNSLFTYSSHSPFPISSSLLHQPTSSFYSSTHLFFFPLQCTSFLSSATTLPLWLLFSLTLCLLFNPSVFLLLSTPPPLPPQYPTRAPTSITLVHSPISGWRNLSQLCKVTGGIFQSDGWSDGRFVRWMSEGMAVCLAD